MRTILIKKNYTNSNKHIYIQRRAIVLQNIIKSAIQAMSWGRSFQLTQVLGMNES